MVDLELTGSTLGGYQVGELLGRGAFGWVYRARQVSLDRPVALKVLDPVVARSPDAARRFDREGRSAAALDHPAIVDVYQAGAVDGLHFLAMRMIDGTGLDRVLARGPMPPRDLLAVLDRIGPALDHAHAAGIVHRDVKPANILLEQGDPRRAWLGDFGIAVSVRAAGEASTTALGTAFYMAPEQVDPARTGPAADQYSLACLTYEALTGRRPFPGDDVMAVLLAHRVDPVPRTGSAPLDSVLGKALAKSPEQRYASVAAFVAALHAALHAAMRAPAAAPQRVRRRVLAGIAAGVLLAAGGVTAAILLTPDPTAPAATTGTENPPSPAGWQQVEGPGPANYSVPAEWRRDGTSGPVSRFLQSGEQVLVVGSDQPGDAVDPGTDLRSLYPCQAEPRTFPLAGGQAAACDAKGKHAIVVMVDGTAVRFAFATTVASETRDTIMASLTLTANRR